MIEPSFIWMKVFLYLGDFLNKGCLSEIVIQIFNILLSEKV
jgi:hypothetical protein